MPDLNVGGQAVIEGVMMRSKDKVATAVRKPNGEIVVKTDPYISFTKRYKILGLPILRGIVSFVEMLIIGIKTLNFSADIAMKELEKEENSAKGKSSEDKPPRSNNLMLGLSAVFAVVVGVFIFFFLPLAISQFAGVNREAVGFNLVAGAIRLTMFLIYVWALSLFGEFRRIFEYHGAEHKSIYCYEMGDELIPERAACHTRFHPRCGTSFILIVALFAIATYAISDTLYAIWTGDAPTLLTRFGIHFSLLPLVAGGSYELLKLSGKTRDNKITKILIKPGLWLQRLTTKEPSPEQLEVGLASLKAAIGMEQSVTVSDHSNVP
ncbi:MAG: DUF1385 domain-containing protein [Candidatus Zixiibacteriota bacterium]|nr:MAG: DUF1385 domain-containing protein [candidate division Zixibacteria bacterium]